MILFAVARFEQPVAVCVSPSLNFLAGASVGAYIEVRPDLPDSSVDVLIERFLCSSPFPANPGTSRLDQVQVVKPEIHASKDDI